MGGKTGNGVANSLSTPASTTVQITPEELRVSAIILGHQRLAVINGHSVGEGDTLTVHTTPTRNVAVQLRVVRIAEGELNCTTARSHQAKLMMPKLRNQSLTRIRRSSAAAN